MTAVAAAMAPAAPESFGAMLRAWRGRRRLSQMALALDAGLSPRHLSFVECGRSRPSAAAVLALAETLDVPLRERNRLLMAAGHAPRYSEQPLGAEAMHGVRAQLARMLDAHAPNPALVIDRHFDVVLANPPVRALAAALPEALRAPTLNVVRASLHPDGFAAWTLNFDEWCGGLLHELERALAVSPDPTLAALDAEVRGYPNVAAARRRAAAAAPSPLPPAAPALFVPWRLALPQVSPSPLSLFTTLATIGRPRDATLQELCIELFWPADESTAEALRRHASGAGATAVG